MTAPNVSGGNAGPNLATPQNVQAVMGDAPAVLGFSSLPPANSVPIGTISYTIEGEQVYSNGTVWISNYLRLKKRPFAAKGITNIQQVMASPPTIALSTTNPAATGQLYATTNSGTAVVTAPYDSAPFAISRAGNPVIGGTSFPNFQYLTFTNIVSQNGSNAVQVSVIFSGTILVLGLKELNNVVYVKVNDQYVSLTPTTIPNTGSSGFLSVTFAAAVTNVRVDFIASNVTTNFLFGSMWTGALTDSLGPAEIRGPRIMVLGDSIGASTGAAGPAQGFVQVFSEYMGWDDVWGASIGGTGMLTAGATAYINRVATDIIPFAPDEVIVQGFYNDNGQSLGNMQAAALALISAIQAGLPACRITFFGPYTPFGVGYQFGNTNAPASTGFVATRQALVNAVAIANSPQVKLLDPSNYTLYATSTLPKVPQTVTLGVAAAVNATTLTVVGPPLIGGGTYVFGDGSRFRVLSNAGQVATIDSCVNAQAVGQTITQAGNCWITGHGFAGTTTGVGNADFYIISDDVHPTNLGHLALGITLAQLYIQNCMDVL